MFAIDQARLPWQDRYTENTQIPLESVWLFGIGNLVNVICLRAIRIDRLYGRGIPRVNHGPINLTP